MIVVGIDMGVKNCAVSILVDNVIKYTGVLTNQLTDVGLIATQKEAIKCEVLELLGRYGEVDLLVIERFTSRGLRGSLGEKICLLIGILIETIPHKSLTLVTAVVWKNAANKKFNLQLAYKHCRVTPHEIDATCLAVYGTAKLAKLVPFDFILSRKTRDLYLFNMEQVSSLKLRKIRYKRKFYDNILPDNAG
jgi:hypothetical protein